MADNSTAYSPFKIVHHTERLEKLRRGEQIVPAHVQIILTGTCSHDCHFCLVGDTPIETDSGEKRIDSICEGDLVVTSSGIGRVTQTGSRMVDSVCEVSAGERRLLITREHPILTARGYVPAGDLITDTDKVAMPNKDGGLDFTAVTDVRDLKCKTRVHNFSVEPDESYVANGIVVHNCAYRWSGYSSNQLFTKDAELASFGTSNPIREIAYEKCLEIIDDCVEMGVGAVQWTGGGEPTVHSRHVEVMRYALDKGLDSALVSHGELFRPGHLENLLRFKWARFSIDAGTPETYGAVRRINPKRMRKTLANIESLVVARDREKSPLVIGTGFVVTKENWQEVVLAAKLVKELGVDNLRISAVFQPDDAAYFADFYQEAVQLCKEASSLADDKFTVFNNFGERVEDLEQKAPDHPYCGYQEFTTYIGDDLNVYRCCVLAYNERGLIGSLKDKRFKELWASEQKQEDFRKFDATKCERCMFNGRLKTILYALDPNPLHANFV